MTRRLPYDANKFKDALKPLLAAFPDTDVTCKAFFDTPKWGAELSRADFIISRDKSAVNFEKVVARYRDYASAHRDHAYTTTIETINKKRSQQLTGLFGFLGEELTPELRRVASARLALRDWTVQTETRRFKNGTKRSYSFTAEAATRAEETVLHRKVRTPKNRFKNATKRSFNGTANLQRKLRPSWNKRSFNGSVQRKWRPSNKNCSRTACSTKRAAHTRSTPVIRSRRTSK